MKKNKGFTPTLTLGENKSKLVSGFTLIELLVVIAIIGILSGIVYASLHSARLKSKDSAVQTQLSSMRVQAEIYYDLHNNSYSGVCDTASTDRGFGGSNGPGLLLETKKATAIPSEINITEGPGDYNRVTCHDSPSAWAVDAPMSNSVSTSNPVMFCVDSVNSRQAQVENNFLGAEDDTACGN